MPNCDMQHLFCVSKKYFYYLFLTFKVLYNHQKKNPLHLYKSFFLRETFFYRHSLSNIPPHVEKNHYL